MTTTFETAKVGDRVWCMVAGWGEVQAIDSSRDYPIAVCFKGDDIQTYTVGGFFAADDIRQTLFWDEIVFEVPVKPMPSLAVDAKVLVWGDGQGPTRKSARHFSHFENGRIRTFDAGLTSWTSRLRPETSACDHWELAE